METTLSEIGQKRLNEYPANLLAKSFSKMELQIMRDRAERSSTWAHKNAADEITWMHRIEEAIALIN